MSYATPLSESSAYRETSSEARASMSAPHLALPTHIACLTNVYGFAPGKGTPMDCCTPTVLEH